MKMLHVAVVIVGVAAACLAAFCGYQYLAVAALGRQTTAQREELATLRESATMRAQARAEGRQIAVQVLQRPPSWSWSEQLPVMVTQVAEIVEGGGSRLDTLQPVPAVERQHLVRFPLRVTLRANLANLTKVLQRTQQAEPLLAVDHLGVRVGQRPGDPLQVEMTLAAYVMANGKPASGGRP